VDAMSGDLHETNPLVEDCNRWRKLPRFFLDSSQIAGLVVIDPAKLPSGVKAIKKIRPCKPCPSRRTSLGSLRAPEPVSQSLHNSSKGAHVYPLTHFYSWFKFSLTTIKRSSFRDGVSPEKFLGLSLPKPIRYIFRRPAAAPASNGNSRSFHWSSNTQPGLHIPHGSSRLWGIDRSAGPSPSKL